MGLLGGRMPTHSKIARAAGVRHLWAQMVGVDRQSVVRGRFWASHASPPHTVSVTANSVIKSTLSSSGGLLLILGLGGCFEVYSVWGRRFLALVLGGGFGALRVGGEPARGDGSWAARRLAVGWRGWGSLTVCAPLLGAFVGLRCRWAGGGSALHSGCSSAPFGRRVGFAWG